MTKVTAPILTFLFSLIMSSASATALSSTVKFEKFADPTENAFSYEVPTNWQTKGGILRKSATNAKPWMTVTSPDNEIKIFFGDPEVAKLYVIPANAFTKDTGLSGNFTRYYSGAEFATLYGKRVLSQAGTNVQLIEVQPCPALVDRMHVMQQRYPQLQPPNGEPRLDPAVARFSFIENGRQYVAGEYVMIALMGTPGAPGAGWSVVGVQGYTAPKEREAEALQIIERIRTSSDINPQWVLSQMNTNNQAGAVAAQQLEQMRQNSSAMLNQQMSSANASLNAQHQATMDMLNQKAANNRANFQYQQAAKAVNHENEMLYIRNQHLEYYRPTGTLYAVPNY
jgi:hypothetical protein